MAQFKHLHVEDYIEIIAGYRLPNGKNNYSIFSPGEPLISLARYDMKVIPSLAEQSISANKGYTDKQAKLAVDLVIKYERQLFKHNIDITPVRTPEYRLPLRTIDRTTKVWIDQDIIKIKFPYNTDQIDQMRTAGKESKGSIRFNQAEKLQEAELTEWNLNWVYSFAKNHNFEIDQSVTNLMNLLLAEEKKSYAIQLQYRGGNLTITNAADSLVEYIDTYLGGINFDNIMQLIDYSPILGYTVDKDIADTVSAEFGPRFWSLCANRQLKVDSMTSHSLVKDLSDYARATNRFPIFVYEPDLSGRLKEEFNKYFPGAMMTLDNKVTDFEIAEDVKVVYTTKIPKKQIKRIPLMVSSAGMLYGGDRQMWIQTAEKVVYFTKDVYNKNTKGPNVCKLS